MHPSLLVVGIARCMFIVCLQAGESRTAPETWRQRVASESQCARSKQQMVHTRLFLLTALTLAYGHHDVWMCQSVGSHHRRFTIIASRSFSQCNLSLRSASRAHDAIEGEIEAINRKRKLDQVQLSNLKCCESRSIFANTAAHALTDKGGSDSRAAGRQVALWRAKKH